jgi:hypothetical protein
VLLRAPLMTRFAFLGVLLALAGCSASPPPVAEAPPAPEPERIDRGPTSMEGEIGGMNEEAVGIAFDALQEDVAGCVKQGSERVREIGGRFVLSMRVDRSGNPRWAYLSESTLGDRDTEKCVLDLVKDRSWPKPVGGEGLASRAFEIDAGTEPVELEAKRVKGTVGAAAETLWRCKKGLDGSFIATAYLRPDGRVKSAGVAPPSEAGEAASDCIVETIAKLRFRSPGKRAAKVTFEVP